MRFWDASAIVPLLVAEETTSRMRALASQDPDMLVWWGSHVECTSALARLRRSDMLDARTFAIASDRLKRFGETWHEVEPSEMVRETAMRFLRVHPLRAADSLQLAAAFVAAEHRPGSLEFVSLDERLAEAAEKEGFPILGAPD